MQIWLSDQGWALASDAFYLPEPGSKLTPHSGCAQPPNCRARGTLSPRGWTCVLLINNCGTLLKAVTSWKILDEGEQHFSDLQKEKNTKKTTSHFFSPQNMLGLQKQEGRQIKKARWNRRDKTSGTNQHMQHNKLLLLETCLCDTRPGCPFWKEAF